MTEQTEWRAKQSSQVACISAEVLRSLKHYQRVRIQPQWHHVTSIVVTAVRCQCFQVSADVGYKAQSSLNELPLNSPVHSHNENSSQMFLSGSELYHAFEGTGETLNQQLCKSTTLCNLILLRLNPATAIRGRLKPKPPAHWNARHKYCRDKAGWWYTLIYVTGNPYIYQAFHEVAKSYIRTHENHICLFVPNMSARYLRTLSPTSSWHMVWAGLA